MTASKKNPCHCNRSQRLVDQNSSGNVIRASDTIYGCSNPCKCRPRRQQHLTYEVFGERNRNIFLFLLAIKIGISHREGSKGIAGRTNFLRARTRKLNLGSGMARARMQGTSVFDDGQLQPKSEVAIVCSIPCCMQPK